MQHKLIPKYMANWNIVKAVASAERKLNLVRTLEGEMKTLLPSTLLELYEMYRLALVRAKSIISILSLANHINMTLFLDSKCQCSSKY